MPVGAIADGTLTSFQAFATGVLRVACVNSVPGCPFASV